MARLFITPREIDYISDLTKEVTKDIIGQKIFYYTIREDLTNVHDVYEEATDKVFNPPVELDALVEWQPETFTTNRFGSEETAKIEVYLHARDLADKDFKVQSGDYFSYGQLFFEITSVVVDKNVYGQVEHQTGFKVAGKQARQGQINVKPLGPTSESIDSEDAVQKTFVQQRGQEENSLGQTGDVRALQQNEKLDPPVSDPQEVSNKGNASITDSSFYGDE
jgi:hypothetical protein